MEKHRNINWFQEVEIEDIRQIDIQIWLHDSVHPAAYIVVIIPSYKYIFGG